METEVKRKPPITLVGGREIRLTQMYRVETYAGLLEGIPRRSMNIDILRRAGSKGMSLFGNPTFRTVPVVLPTRMQAWPKKEWMSWVMPSEPDTLPRDAPEILPGFLTVARLISSPLRDDPENGDASLLSVIWFQHDPHQFIEEEPFEHLRRVNWELLAESWGY